MAHFAKLGINSKVIAVHVVSDKNCQNADGVEDEEIGRQFLERVHHWPLWKQTSWNTAGGIHSTGGTPLRGTYAGIGMYYDEDNDIFHAKQPYPSWTLNTTTAQWEPPTPNPNDGLVYDWNESTKAWDPVIV